MAQLLGMYHRRIEYPQNKIVEIESRRAASGGGQAGGPEPGSCHVVDLPFALADRRTVRPGVESPLPLRGIARRGARADGLRAPEPASLAIILADDREIAALNCEHMGKEGPTDVLSFPLLPPGAFPPHPGQDRVRR